ncbi:MAG TPA: hypothetical protein VE420_09760 [Gemmatimonadales bacterium]|nr:hypothetical protein [Gemmatimonadales bacterium]
MTNTDHSGWIRLAEVGRGATALMGVGVRRGVPAKQASVPSRVPLAAAEQTRGDER